MGGEEREKGGWVRSVGEWKNRWLREEWGEDTL